MTHSSAERGDRAKVATGYLVARCREVGMHRANVEAFHGTRMQAAEAVRAVPTFAQALCFRYSTI